MDRSDKTREEARPRIKAAIRKGMVQRRGNLSQEDAREKCRAIARRMLALPEYKGSEVVHCYVSAKNNEVDTHHVIERALKDGKRVLIPVTNLADRSLLHSELISLDELERSTFGLLEPKQEYIRPVDAEEIDLVIVPGLAFDLRGNRIGFGGGVYDRFLAPLNAPKISLAYQFQILHEIETDPHDVRVDKIVTEAGVYEVRDLC